MKNLFALFSGVLFGFGLAISGMTDTAKVIGFLDLFGNWIPDLIFVMGAAVATTMIGFYFIFKYKSKPLFDTDFNLPLNQTLDRKLILGASIFGIGWGLYGYCPGPAIASLGSFTSTLFSTTLFTTSSFSYMPLLFVIALILGMWIGERLQKNM